MNRLYRMVFIDLDGTTLTTDKRITPRTKNVLEHLDAHGIPVIIATGRAIYSVRELFLDVRLKHPVITLNGAVIFERLSGSVLYYEKIDEKALSRLLMMAEKDARIENMLLEALGGYYVRRYDDEVQMTFTDYRKIPPRPLDVESLSGDAVTNLLLRPRDEDKAYVHAQLQEALNGEIYFAKTSWTWLEGIRAGVHKAHAMRVVARRLGIPLEEVVAFGDEWNDVEMLKEAGLGVAMENGSELAKAAADLIAPSNDEEGLARMLEEIFADVLTETGYRRPSPLTSLIPYQPIE
ncbi:MAG: HAD family hydrolase [Candidatus Carbobacillus altaicus]|nr:HAD family hydrolase [Candidatus Carbobacillus altaicus]